MAQFPHALWTGVAPRLQVVHAEEEEEAGDAAEDRVDQPDHRAPSHGTCHRSNYLCVAVVAGHHYT